jgi:hypothetical protein
LRAPPREAISPEPAEEQREGDGPVGEGGGEQRRYRQVGQAGHVVEPGGASVRVRGRVRVRVRVRVGVRVGVRGRVRVRVTLTPTLTLTRSRVAPRWR